jgi:hypothetical protein
MAITLIRKLKVDSEGYINLMFSTKTIFIKSKELSSKTEDVMIEQLIGEATLVDDMLKPISESSKYEIQITEEEFHTDLRKQAAERNQLITSHSTDAEWNPEGYTNNLEDTQ